GHDGLLILVVQGLLGQGLAPVPAGSVRLHLKGELLLDLRGGFLHPKDPVLDGLEELDVLGDDLVRHMLDIAAARIACASPLDIDSLSKIGEDGRASLYVSHQCRHSHTFLVGNTASCPSSTP